MDVFELGLKLGICKKDIDRYLEKEHCGFTFNYEDLEPLFATAIDLKKKLNITVPSKLTDHTISPEIKESEPLLRIELSDDIIIFIRKKLIQVVYTKDVDCGIILEEKLFPIDKIDDVVEFINSIK